MEDFKSLYTSRTFWGVIVSVLGKILSVAFGYTLDAEAEGQLISFLMLLVSGVGDMLALYGRIKATKVIGAPK